MTDQAPPASPTTPEPSATPAPPPGLFSAPAPSTATATPDTTAALDAQPVPPAGSVASGSTQNQPLPPLQQLVIAEKNTLGDSITALVTHATKPGARTSEFWAQFIAPPVTFGITLAGSWAVTHGIVGDSVVANAIPPAAASLTAALATWAAKLYCDARARLKLSGLDTARVLSYNR